MRLIDTENAIDCADCIVYDYCRAGIFRNCKCIVENIFDSQPIAYDVDKVVDELERKKALYDINFQGWSMSRIQDAIDIVKKGGVDEYETI